MDPVEFLSRSGGVAGAVLLQASSRRSVERALDSGAVVRVGRGRYALPAVTASLGVAHDLSGVLSHLSAARFWGWEVATPLGDVDVIVPRSRHPRAASGVVVRRRDLAPSDLASPGVTTPLRTLLDVAADLPLLEALPVADSALRSHLVFADELVVAAAASGERGRTRRLRVAFCADERADNQFESALRALCLEAGLGAEPQVSLFTGDRWVRPQLLDDRRGLAVEVELPTWQGHGRQLMADCRKYNDLTLLGLRLVRLTWEQLMLEPGYARSVLRACVDGPAPWQGVPAARPSWRAA